MWFRVPPEWGATLLTDQIGVYFSGDRPPEKLIALGAQARVRVTCTITGDGRINATATPRSSSPNFRDVTLWLDLSDRFHRRAIASSDPWTGQDADGVQSVFGSQLDTAFGKDERDDALAIATYVKNIQTYEDSALLRANIVLYGLHFSYEIGDLITSIDGRNISLNRNSAASSEKKYLQVTGIRLDTQAQSTTLMVEATEERLQ